MDIMTAEVVGVHPLEHTTWWYNTYCCSIHLVTHHSGKLLLFDSQTEALYYCRDLASETASPKVGVIKSPPVVWVRAHNVDDGVRIEYADTRRFMLDPKPYVIVPGVAATLTTQSWTVGDYTYVDIGEWLVILHLKPPPRYSL